MDCAELTISRTLNAVMPRVTREMRLTPLPPAPGSESALRKAAKTFCAEAGEAFSPVGSSVAGDARCFEVTPGVAATAASFAAAVDTTGPEEIDRPTRMPAMKIPPPAMRYFQRPLGDLIMIYFP